MRYRLEPGDHLHYERHTTSVALDTGRPVGTSIEHVHIWCFQRRDGETLVLLTISAVAQGRSEELRAGAMYLDEFGRRRIPPEMAPSVDRLQPALDLLPVLPVGAQRPDTWSTAPDLFRRVWRCNNRGAGPPPTEHIRVDFVVEDDLGVAEVLGLSCAGSYWFDPRAGCVTRYESEVRDESQQRRTHLRAALVQRTREPVEWVERRSEETLRFLRTLGYENALLDELVYPGSPWPRTRARLEQLWTAFGADVDARAASPLAPLVDARRRELRSAAERFEARAALGLRWLNQPAGTWTLQDPNGATLTSETARRGVVVECFWTSATPDGPRILEAMRTLQSELPATQVRVLCYDLDADPRRAPRVIARCGAGPQHLLASPLTELEPFSELPIVRVLDAQGIVRGVWIGWRPSWNATRDLVRSLLIRP